MNDIEKQCRRFWYPVEFFPRWADRDHEAAVTGDGLILLKLRVHERCPDGLPTKVSLIRRLDPEAVPLTHRAGWLRWIGENPEKAAEYWGAPHYIAELAKVLGVADVQEGVMFTLHEVCLVLKAQANRLGEDPVVARWAAEHRGDA